MAWEPKTRGSRPGGTIKAASTTPDGSPLVVRARIEGLEKTSAEFRAARRRFNATMRSVLQAAGELIVLPAVKHNFKRLTGRFAGSLYVQRDRTTVFIGSRMRGGENRAVGWIDFGGRHPRHQRRRKGPYVIVRELNRRRSGVEQAVLKGLMKNFDPLEHRP
jgi:hypothetical protein